MKWIAAVAGLVLAGAAHAADAPNFQVDPFWPKSLPNNWIMGQAAGVAVDAQDHIWVVQRPHTLTDDEKAASLTPPRSKCCVPAPPVLEFDQQGKLLRSWGGKGEGYDWPANEHGIYIDQNDILYSTDSESRTPVAYGFHPGWGRGIRLGSVKDGIVRAWIPDIDPEADRHITSGGEGIWVHDGVIYSAQVRQQAVVRYTLKK